MNVEKHIRSLQIALADSMQPRAKVYLDLNFWILIREAAAGNDSRAAAQELFRLLREGVAQGRLVCPISESTFIELMKQWKTPTRRAATARIIDELSLGVTLIPLETRARTEIAHFFHGKMGSLPLYDMKQLVWTKLGFVLGNLYPRLSGLGLDGATQDFILEGYISAMWASSLSDIAAKCEFPPDNGDERLAAKLNKANATYAHELVSYEQTYMNELRGGIDLFGDVGADVIRDCAERQGMQAPTNDKEQRNQTANACKNLLVAAFAQPEHRRAMRTIHIHVALHANLRWDKRRNFKPNDFLDFQHATAALGYCDAFFTEGPLRALTTMKNANLPGINNCRVTDDLDEANSILRTLT